MAEAVLNNIDQMMMAQNGRGDDGVTAGRLRESRMKAFYGGEPTAAVEVGREQSLRERVQGARKAFDLKQKAKDKVEERVAAPLKMGSAKLLQMAWFNLIPSFGLTLIWINIHAFMRMVPGFSSAFCKIGDEWVPKEAKAITGEMGQMGAGVALLEKAGIVFLDIAVILILITFFTIAMMILDYVFNFGWFWHIVSKVGDAMNSMADAASGN